MIKINHFPYGMNDAYIKINGCERIPNEPLEKEPCNIEFSVNSGGAGQRAWIEFEDSARKDIRAQFQYSRDEIAYWKAEILNGIAGERIKYRICFGQGKKSAVKTELFEYTVMKWESIGLDSLNKLFNLKGDLSEELLDIKVLTDSRDIYSVKLSIKKEEKEAFFGFGEHYESLKAKEEEKRYLWVVNQYKVQRNRSYAPVPFFFSKNGRGFFFDTPYLTEVVINKEKIYVLIDTKGDTWGKTDLYYWKREKTIDIIKEIQAISNPCYPPKWVFGPWLSANEWNSQKKIEEVLKKVKDLDLPSKVIVIEAWTDEQTYYIFNGAEYKAGKGDKIFNLDDFQFKYPWPDPVGMVKKLDSQGIKLVLWNIPILKKEKFEECEQLVNDKKYASENLLSIKNNNGDYGIPEGQWFEGSGVVDFFNEKACKWWINKRKYLNKLGVAGLKTDGGEHLYYRDTKGKDISQSKMRNIYPEKYLFSAKKILEGETALFSRSGYTRSPSSSLFWVGDEDSDFDALRGNIIAGLNVSISGNPIWGWDIAGFSGEMPSVELYLRSLQIALFTPIFQWHSETSGDPQPSAERSPWNMEKYWEKDGIIDYYRKIVSLRMSLIPYIEKEVKYALDNNLPLTLPLEIINKKEKESLAYFFGRDILVVPIVDKELKEVEIEFPEGNWIDLRTGQTFNGGEMINIGLHKFIPLFVRKGSNIPISLPESKRILDTQWNPSHNAYLQCDFHIDKEINGYINGFLSKKTNDLGLLEIEWRV